MNGRLSAGRLGRPLRTLRLLTQKALRRNAAPGPAHVGKEHLGDWPRGYHRRRPGFGPLPVDGPADFRPAGPLAFMFALIAFSASVMPDGDPIGTSPPGRFSSRLHDAPANRILRPAVAPNVLSRRGVMRRRLRSFPSYQEAHDRAATPLSLTNPIIGQSVTLKPLDEHSVRAGTGPVCASPL